MDRSNRQPGAPRSTFAALRERMVWDVSHDPLHLGYLGLAQGVPLVVHVLAVERARPPARPGAEHLRALLEPAAARRPDRRRAGRGRGRALRGGLRRRHGGDQRPGTADLAAAARAQLRSRAAPALPGRLRARGAWGPPRGPHVDQSAMSGPPTMDRSRGGWG